MPWEVDWMVSVNGADMSSKMAPYLVDIEVTDQAGSSSDTCSITLDDSGGTMAFPSEGGLVIVGLMGAQVFEGTIDSTTSIGSRGGGRLLKVGAKGFDSRGKVKEGQHFHKDDATLQEFLEESARRAGYSITVDPDLASKQRPYWSSDGTSFLGLGEKMAREFNATFKIRGSQAVLVPRGKDLVPGITGRCGPGGNVISWDIAPYTGRDVFTKAKVRWFDRAKAKFEEKEVGIDSERPLPDATNLVRGLAADEAQATDMAEGRKGESEREGGHGSVEIDLEPSAQAEGMFTLIGARPGVDGTYRIESVTHRANRSAGSTTKLSLKQPGGGAGQDSRNQ